MRKELTDHAQQSMRQRGVRDIDWRILAVLADEGRAVGRALMAWSLSDAALDGAVAEGLARSMADRLRGLVLIESSDGSVVTVGHLHGRKGKAWRRRERRKFWRN